MNQIESSWLLFAKQSEVVNSLYTCGFHRIFYINKKYETIIIYMYVFISMCTDNLRLAMCSLSKYGN